MVFRACRRPVRRRRASGSRSGYHVVRDIPIGGQGGWDYAILDPATHRLYVSHATKIVVVDTVTDRSSAKSRIHPGCTVSRSGPSTTPEDRSPRSSRRRETSSRRSTSAERSKRPSKIRRRTGINRRRDDRVQIARFQMSAHSVCALLECFFDSLHWKKHPKRGFRKALESVTSVEGCHVLMFRIEDYGKGSNLATDVKTAPQRIN